jgi:hypothetical protein
MLGPQPSSAADCVWCRVWRRRPRAASKTQSTVHVGTRGSQKQPCGVCRQFGAGGGLHQLGREPLLASQVAQLLLQLPHVANDPRSASHPSVGMPLQSAYGWSEGACAQLRTHLPAFVSQCPPGLVFV